MEVCDVAILQKELLVYCSQSTVEKIIEAYLVETEEAYKAKKKALETLKEKTIEESNASIKLKAADEAEKPKPTAESAEKPKPSEDPGKPKTSEEVKADKEKKSAIKWSWERLIYSLCNEDLTKMNQVTDMLLIPTFNMLGMKKELNI